MSGNDVLRNAWLRNKCQKHWLVNSWQSLLHQLLFGKHNGIVHAHVLKTAGTIEHCDDDDVDCSKVQLGCDSGDRATAL